MNRVIRNDLTAPELLLQELGVTEPGDIDLEAIAYHVGCEVRYRPLDGCEACILGAGDRAIITITTRCNERRQRFSLGHELGHWHYYRGRSSICRPDDIGNLVRSALHPERIVDNYAAGLLLPRYLFEPRIIGAARPSFSTVEQLAIEFRTSITATALRLVELTPSVVLICHTSKGRKWFKAAADVPSRWFPRDDLDADSYAFDVLHRDEDRSRIVKIGADAWFERNEASRYEIFEETIRVGASEILTLLTLSAREMIEEWSHRWRRNTPC
jgi:hypothetical protein